VPESGLFIDGVDGSMRWQLRTAAYPLPAASAGPAVPLHRVDVEVTFGDPERPSR
jgi:hypothetical protein